MRFFGFLFGFIAVLSGIIGISDYTCSKWDAMCVLAPVVPDDVREVQVNAETLDDRLQLSSSWEAFEGLKFIRRSYRFGLESVVQVVAVLNDADDIVVDTLDGALDAFTSLHDREGRFLIGAYTRPTGEADIILYASEGAFVKRVYPLTCQGNEAAKVPLAVSNMSYDAEQRRLVFDARGDCGFTTPVRLSSGEVIGGDRRSMQFGGRRFSDGLSYDGYKRLTALLNDDFNITEVLTQKEANSRRKNADGRTAEEERLYQNTVRYENCLADGPDLVRARYPSSRTNVLYCWHYTEYGTYVPSDFADRTGYYIGGAQQITALHVTANGVERLIEHNCSYAPSDDDLYYAADVLDAGFAVALNSSVAVVGCDGAANIGPNHRSKRTGSRGTDLYVASAGAVLPVTIGCECERLLVDRNAAYDEVSGVLSIFLVTDAKHVSVGGQKFVLVAGGDDDIETRAWIAVRFGPDGKVEKISRKTDG